MDQHSSQPTVTAVIVTYQSRAVVSAALEALREGAERGEVQCVVVDNLSSDGTADYVRREFPFAQVVEPGANLGFGRGCNLGFAQAKAKYTIFVNPDAAISRESLRTMVAFLDARPEVGICVPAIPGQPAGLMTTPAVILREAMGLSAYPNAVQTTARTSAFQTSWAGGAIFMIRSSLFRELTGFDPRFFLYFEETDLCRRAAARGAQIWVLPEAPAEHAAHASAVLTGKTLIGGNIAEYFFQSRFYYLRKHWGYGAALLTELLELPPLTLRALSRAVRRHHRPGPSALAQRLQGTLFQAPPAQP